MDRLKHAMVDIETMGNTTDVPIVSIGVVLYCPVQRKIEPEKFYRVISLESNYKAGLIGDASTVEWWLQQSDEAREIFSTDTQKETLKTALEELVEFTHKHCGYKGGYHNLKLWGNGVGFDNVHLRNAFSAVGLRCPYAFWNDMCYRTIKNMYPDIKLERGGIHHNALDDAMTQMKHLLKITGGEL